MVVNGKPMLKGGKDYILVKKSVYSSVVQATLQTEDLIMKTYT